MWYKNYKIYFQSRTGTQYCVYILEQTEGTSHTLMGGAEPFVTQEDDNDDIFTPIRKQTGYLRIVGDQNIDIMEVLMPRNNVEKMAQLWSGTWDSDMTTFTDGTLQWQGFLVAQAFSQPAENGRHIIEFPVKSMLGALEDIYMDYQDVSRINHICWLLAQASMALMNSSTQSPWSEYYFIDDVDHIGNGIDSMFPAMAYPFMDWSVLYDDIDTKNDGLTTSSVSYYDALSHVCSLFGAQIREQGTKLYVSQYDNASQCRVKKLLWAAVRSSQGTSLMPHTDIGALSYDSQTLPDITFLIKGSQKSYIPGNSKFEVLINLEDSTFRLTPGKSVEDSSAPIQVQCIDDVTVLVQPHSSAVGPNTENYYYYHCDVSFEYDHREDPETGESWDYISYIYGNYSVSTYSDCVLSSVLSQLGRLVISPDTRNVFTTGAFPCRWSLGDILTSALFLNIQPVTDAVPYHQGYSSDSWTGHIIYRLLSTQSLQGEDGFININFKLNRFRAFWNDSSYNGIKWNGDDPYSAFYSNAWIRMRLSLKIGNDYFVRMDGTTAIWSTNETSFYLEVKNGQITSNRSLFNLKNNGFYIPASGKVGPVEFCIYDYFMYNRFGTIQVFSAILTDLAISFEPIANITGTTDNENRYFRNEPTGFSGTKSIDTVIGTFNNNQPSASFIQAYDSDEQTYNNIESFVYRRDSSERPEMHLLDRMVAHGSEVRKNITYCVRSFVSDLMQTIYQKGSKYFFGVDAKHDWREDEQQIKFIEITDEI